jgi:hypothetical protein
MSDRDTLQSAGIPFFSVVDENGVSTDGELATISLIRNRGMEPICEVSAVGVATSGSTIATLRNRGIQFYCPVDEDGLTSGAVTMTTLRQRGVPFFCPVGVNGIATDGTLTITQLAARGIPYVGLLDSLGAAGGSPVVVPDAPVLIWTSLATESDPTFDVLLDTPLVGDTIYLQIDDNALFSSPAEYTNTIDAGEAVAMAVQFTGFTLLADGTWYARAKHNTSDWSNTETKTIAAATGPAVGDGLLLDNGTDFLLLDNGDFLLLS